MNKKRINYPVRVWEPHYNDLVFICDLALGFWNDDYNAYHLYCSMIAHEAVKEFTNKYPKLKVILHDGQKLEIKGKYELYTDLTPQFEVKKCTPQFKIIQHD
jgi:hypothetical protein